jgi:hypothetical protein
LIKKKFTFYFNINSKQRFFIDIFIKIAICNLILFFITKNSENEVIDNNIIEITDEENLLKSKEKIE